jgi:hypothetical protein
MTAMNTDRPSDPALPPRTIDLEAARLLVDALQRDLEGIDGDRAEVAQLKAELVALRRVLHAEEPDNAAVHGLTGMQDRLHGVQEALKSDAFQAGRYLAEIGRILGL